VVKAERSRYKSALVEAPVRLRRVLLLIAASLLATGCPPSGSAGPTTSVAPGVSQPAEFKAALLHPGPTTDAGWNALGYDGIQLVEKELGCKVETVEEGHPQKFEDNLADFARRGAKVVFAHGYEYQDPCLAVGKKFPETVFVVSSGDKTAANECPIVLRLDESCYLAGILAAHVTKTKKIGAVGGMQIPPVKSGFEAFARGARKVDPKVEVVPAAYLGTWDDVQKGREQALALLAAGCDVIIHNADHAGLGVFSAAKDKGALAVGTNRNQNDVEGGSVVVASAVLDVPKAMLDIARSVKEGRFAARPWVLDLKSGYSDLVLNEQLKDRIPEEARKEIADARAAILAGTLDPNKD
jgi:basic membrane lipoprotein Med (substrate-binding protein (PBP1-ABC) superfamily)